MAEGNYSIDGGVEHAERPRWREQLSPEALRHLVKHSANVGALDASFATQTSVALELERMPERDLLTADAPLAAVSAHATIGTLTARPLTRLQTIANFPERGTIVMRATVGMAPHPAAPGGQQGVCFSRGLLVCRPESTERVTQ